MADNNNAFAFTAIGFLAGAILANPARKMALQGAEAVMSKDWYDALLKEHRLVQKKLKMALDTDDNETAKRATLINAIDHALTKHSLQEEKVIYPALHRIDTATAQHMMKDHGEIKTLLSELQFDIPKSSPLWRERLRALKAELDEHMQEEENDIFLGLRHSITRDENRTLTKHMHMQGAAIA
jgi:hemerythrin superfamily protein